MNRYLFFMVLWATLPAVASAQEESGPVTLEALTKRVDALDRLSLSGYIQARYLVEQRSTAADPRDTFLIRRGRIKASYDADWSKFVLQIDASGSGVSLKDAEVHLIEPWTPYKIALVVGQTKWPFGYEVVESSSAREFPERTRVVRAFASNERDRGAKFVSKFGWFRFTGGVFNGNGIDREAPFNARDNDDAKDVIGRVGFDLKWISGGISGWYGNTYRHQSEDVSARYFDRTRIGADLQLGGKLLPIGKSILRAEYIAGTTYWANNAEQFGRPANGWYALVSQYVGEKSVVSVRYDYFDPAAGTSPSVSSSGRPSSSNPVGTWGVAVSHTWFEQLRLTAAYEIPVTVAPEGSSDPADNLLTLQAQMKF